MAAVLVACGGQLLDKIVQMIQMLSTAERKSGILTFQQQILTN